MHLPWLVLQHFGCAVSRTALLGVTPKVLCNGRGGPYRDHGAQGFQHDCSLRIPGSTFVLPAGCLAQAIISLIALGVIELRF